MQDSSQEHHGRAEPSQSSRRLDELRAVARELAGFATSKSALEAVLGHFPARLEAEIRPVTSRRRRITGFGQLHWARKSLVDPTRCLAPPACSGEEELGLHNTYKLTAAHLLVHFLPLHKPARLPAAVVVICLQPTPPRCPPHMRCAYTQFAASPPSASANFCAHQRGHGRFAASRPS